MVELQGETLRQLQLVELEMLLEVDRICQKCGLHYNVIGGTLLGAVRHGGFIPWDDDADLVMFRKDYEKFRDACKTELDKSRFYFQDMDVTDGYRWGYGKLRRKGTVFMREGQEHMPYEQGVFIDIMPLDNVPDSYLGRKTIDVMCYCLRKMFWSAVGRFTAKNIFVRFWFQILYMVPFFLVRGAVHIFLGLCRCIESREVRILFMPNPRQDACYHRRWFESNPKIKFEGAELCGIEDYEGFLTWEFRDYMQIPPEDKRKVHPVSEIKLTQPVLPEGVGRK